YEFRPRPRAISLATWPVSPSDDATWHAMEPTGRWTTGRSTMTIDVTPNWARLRISVANFHARQMTALFRLGLAEQLCSFEAHEKKSVVLDRQEGMEQLEIACAPISPSSYGLVQDSRHLGIFVEQLEYAD